MNWAMRLKRVLHLCLHLGIREQIATNRPTGITAIYQQLLTRLQGEHLEVEHRMIVVLAEALWNAQRNHAMPDEKEYLAKLRSIS